MASGGRRWDQESGSKKSKKPLRRARQPSLLVGTVCWGSGGSGVWHAMDVRHSDTIERKADVDVLAMLMNATTSLRSLEYR